MAEHWDLISVDDHIIEPRDVWSSRLPTAHREVGPRVVEEDGQEIWVYEDRRHRTVGLYAIAGKTVDEYHNDPDPLLRHAPRLLRLGRAHTGHGP